MIYTITFSPCVDYVIDNVDKKFNPNGLTRFENYTFHIGGKGLNASVILNELNIKNKAITFNYGVTSSFFKNLINQTSLKNNIVLINSKTKSDLRINIKYLGNNNFDINGPAPKLNKADYDKLFNILNKLQPSDMVFIMGKCDESVLNKVLKIIQTKQAQFVVDIDSKKILELLKYKPLLIKPNIDELGWILNKTINKTNLFTIMKDLKKKGARNVIVSMGKDGSYLLDEHGHLYHTTIKKVQGIRSAVGCGDTLIASFITYKYFENNSSSQAIKKATAFAVATAQEYFLGNKKRAKENLSKVSVKEIKTI